MLSESPRQLILDKHVYRNGSVDYRVVENGKNIAGQYTDQDRGFDAAHVYQWERGFTFQLFRSKQEPQPKDDIYGVARIEGNQ